MGRKGGGGEGEARRRVGERAGQGGCEGRILRTCMRGGEGGSGSRGRVRAQRRGPSRFPPLDRPTQSLSLSLVQVTLEGHTGAQAGYMGVYELSAETDDGAPLGRLEGPAEGAE